MICVPYNSSRNLKDLPARTSVIPRSLVFPSCRDDAAQEEEEGEEVDVATGPQSAQAPAAAAPKSKFAAFVSANKAESHIPTFGQPEEGIDQGGASGEEDGGRVCKVQGCSKRAVENVEVCPVHTKRFSVVSVSAMVHEFKGTKLSSVALKSDKVNGMVIDDALFCVR